VTYLEALALSRSPENSFFILIAWLPLLKKYPKGIKEIEGDLFKKISPNPSFSKRGTE